MPIVGILNIGKFIKISRQRLRSVWAGQIQLYDNCTSGRMQLKGNPPFARRLFASESKKGNLYWFVERRIFLASPHRCVEQLPK